MIVCVCRCQGYVYTYRLQKDVSGSWAADVRHFILPPFIVNLRSARLKKQLHTCSSYSGSLFFCDLSLNELTVNFW